MVLPIGAVIIAWLISGVSAVQQQVLSASSPTNFSVGFSLQSSYGAAAVIIEDEDGNLHTRARVHYGGETYERVMARLSLSSSRHLAPPYEDMGDYFEDQPRRAVRNGLKKIGLPASHDVSVLASVIDVLKSQLERENRIKVTEAVFTSSHLLALYQDDLMDMADHLKVKYITPKRQFKPILWETAASYAGYGFGLCEHWQDKERCTKEYNALPDINILAVHYSRTALTVGFVPIQSAVGAFEPDEYHLENFTLGADAVGNYLRPEEYWSGVEYTLLHAMRDFRGLPRPTKIMMTGDMAGDETFVSFLKSTMENYMGSVPTILSEKALTAAAEGAAELMRRGPAPWSR